METTNNSAEIGSVLVRRSSKVHLYAHLVWRTRGSQPNINRFCERQIHRAIAGEAIRLGCRVIAINGMPDHVHLLVRMPSVLCVAILVKQIKGASAATMNAINRAQDPLGTRFRWQDSYACFSVGGAEVDRIVGYIRDQKRHHASDDIWPEWEETDEVTTTEQPLPEGYPAAGP